MLPEKTNTDIINLTSSAVKAVKDLLEQRDLDGYALRIFISGGGCAGLQYGMALDNNLRESDNICEFDGVKVAVDEVSIQYMRGSTIDYINDVMASGFKIDNPNAVASCGCGNSFNTRSGESPQTRTSGCSGCF